MNITITMLAPDGRRISVGQNPRYSEYATRSHIPGVDVYEIKPDEKEMKTYNSKGVLVSKNTLSASDAKRLTSNAISQGWKVVEE